MEKSNNNVHKGIILMLSLLWNLFQIIISLVVGGICLIAVYVLLFENIG